MTAYGSATYNIKYDCYVCRDNDWEGKDFLYCLTNQQFIVCPTCGNKRCPKATWHENPCTGSNDAGQIGSRFQ